MPSRIGPADHATFALAGAHARTPCDKCHAKDSATLVSRLEEIMGRAGIGVREVDLQRDLVEKKLQVSITAVCAEDADIDKLSRAFSELPDVEKVEID